MKAQLAKKIAAVAFSAVLATGLVPFAAPYSALAADGSASAPTMDGSLSEWSGIAKQTSTDSDVDYWQVAKDSDGNVYLAISGTADNGWSISKWQWNKPVTAKKGSDTASLPLEQLASNGWTFLKGSYEIDYEAKDSSAGPVYVEVKLNASSFKGSDDYSITFAGTTVKASDIPTFGSSSSSSSSSSSTDTSSSSSSTDTSSSSSASDEPATYGGITIDGKFSDWDAVEKHDGSKGIESAAMVFDGDHVYLYLKDEGNSSATWSGPNGNGRFAIRTDSGHVLMVHVERDQVLAGDRPVDFQHVGDQWEIDVPASLLPAYQKTISFGFHDGKTFVADVANLKKSDDDNNDKPTFSGITYDGDYSDWAAYPHTEIEYSTAGTQEEAEDSEGALYSSDGMLYTHVKTTMPAHTKNEKGGEFLAAVTYDFGDGRMYYPNFASVDSQGNISWYSAGSQLSPGTHELYLFDTQGWNNSTNINNLSAGDRNYGRVTVTVSDDGSIDEMESEIDLSQVAKKFNCSADDFKTIRAQFGRLGQQWLETAGTPTDPWLGTGIAIASVLVVVGGYALYRRRKQGARAAVASANGANGAETADAAQTQEQAR